MSEQKLCKDCKHFIWPLNDWENAKCSRVVWPIYGTPKPCYGVRGQDGECGKDGGLYEHGPTPEPVRKPWWKVW